MITLYQFEVSPFCDKVRRAMRYKNIPFSVQEVSLLGAGKYSSAKKLPVLDDTGTRIEDSTQIVHYLEQKYPEPPLLPADPAQLALCNVLEDWADESLYYYDIALHFSFAENAKRRAGHLLQHEKPWVKRLMGPFVPGLLRKMGESQGAGRRSREVILSDIDRHIGSIAAMLEGQDFLLPTGLSAADISIFVEIDAIKVAELGAEIISRYPVVVAWMDRVDALTGEPQ
ncbi:glutathione S-transferase family protein [Halieaceae bacterium IMCC14734]|uniref:Glutathione S-transferase family protein n=1 Tax=Candidatus Litorirhabdus singularis TaxID=2518993 RepID=A0ABT3TJN2_9GAMM|nr:glutathione S-transferase family protein [Candidatus Litorirhabdus singularis]MCX2982523.1 glutathione S-transferase family protein [Candidatus Litorirhabdus singularis]